MTYQQKARDRMQAERLRQTQTGEFDFALLEQMDAAAWFCSVVDRAQNRDEDCQHYWVHDASGGMILSGSDLIDTTVEHVYCARCFQEKGD